MEGEWNALAFQYVLFCQKKVTGQLSLVHGLWHPTWHYDAHAYLNGEIHAEAPWFCEICPSTNANCHNETTFPLYSRIIKWPFMVPSMPSALQLNLQFLNPAFVNPPAFIPNCCDKISWGCKTWFISFPLQRSFVRIKSSQMPFLHALLFSSMLPLQPPPTLWRSPWMDSSD